MKIFINLLITTFFAFSLVNTSFAAETTHHHEMNAEQGYSCPMHPEVTGVKGDTCPKCGMNLTKTEAAAYHCPMHPEVTGEKGDTCPKCGMDLEPVTAKAHHHH